jgi:uncharacterized protein
MAIFAQFVIGLIFGLGLILAGMSDPAKVQNFLDLAAFGKGGWDPSLAFVIAGGIGVTFIGYRLVSGWKKPVFADVFQSPAASTIDQRLLTGAAIFGIGWGLAGFCPGPAFSALGLGRVEPLMFIAAMLVGMVAAWKLASRAKLNAS